MRLIGLILLIGFTRIIRSLSVKSAPSLLFGPNRIHYARSLRVNVRLASVALCLTLCAARAQEPPPAPQEPIQTLKLSTRIVGVSAVVLDNRGEPVRGLAKEDFTLKEDGKEQEIRYFSQDSDLPLTLALMVDTSGSQKMFIQDESDASRKFFKVMLTSTSVAGPLASPSPITVFQPENFAGGGQGSIARAAFKQHLAQVALELANHLADGRLGAATARPTVGCPRPNP